MLVDMEQVEKIQEQLKGVETQIAERARVRDLAQSQLDERRNDVGHRLSELETERQHAAAVVPAAALTIFEEMADVYEGESMAPVEEIDRRHREYACGECNMHIPFEQVSLLTSRNDSVIRCPSCMRILFMQEEMRGSLAKK